MGSIILCVCVHVSMHTYVCICLLCVYMHASMCRDIYVHVSMCAGIPLLPLPSPLPLPHTHTHENRILTDTCTSNMHIRAKVAIHAHVRILLSTMRHVFKKQTWCTHNIHMVQNFDHETAPEFFFPRCDVDAPRAQGTKIALLFVCASSNRVSGR